MGHHPPEVCWKPGVDTPDAIEVCRSTHTRSSPDLSTRESQSRPSNDTGSASEAPREPRKFLVQPVETSSRSSKTQAPPPEQIATVKIETTKTSNRRAYSASEVQEQNSSSHTKTSPAPRRFKPDLIETDTRSVRRGQLIRLSQRHNAVGHSATFTDINKGTSHWPDNHPSSESKFSYSSLLRQQQARRHSFRIPELPSIPSNSSEESDDSRSHSECTSLPGSSGKATKYEDDTKLPLESCDKELSEYLLSIAARSAQMQLKDQTLAAFPNEQVYEPVDHFGIDYDRDSEEDVSPLKYHHVKSRRQSSADLSWELEYMRHHKEEAEMRLRAMITSGQPGLPPEHKKNGRSPPMLGNDIVIPQSLSPEGTICEHSNMDILSHGAQELCTGCDGLWCAAPCHDGSKGTGLWMGTCSKDEDRPRQVHGLFPGIKTPMPRIDSMGSSKGLSPSPSHTHLDRLAASPGNNGLRKPTSPILQKVIESEFHDGFVTQIYNYLSLGYPCIAQYYDHELSRISGISVEDLRRDDLNTDAKGYVVAPENDKIADACARWKALRLYIQEWARQEPGMAEDETNLDSWGLPERKGSWGI
ncbi:uncharacterized protein N7529_007925 [Penicillium soppii]|uniref:uncharacterized protein n=1 Tax=Penicillium soppii TaxID=69789 RepID=UPI002549334B|nr:uncharacterized protein N7529_007925 [Penicillium soppii]KAJ5860615.1 hypothetical protein N7529_007925 [Penicillium soppii]